MNSIIQSVREVEETLQVAIQMQELPRKQKSQGQKENIEASQSPEQASVPPNTPFGTERTPVPKAGPVIQPDTYTKRLSPEILSEYQNATQVAGSGAMGSQDQNVTPVVHPIGSQSNRGNIFPE